MRRLTAAGLLLGVSLLVSGCGGGEPATASGLPERSIEVAEVTVAAVPERLDATGALFRLKLDTHTTPLDMDLPGATRLTVGGRDWPAQTWIGDGPGGHHREGTLRFRAAGPAEGPVRLVIEGLGKPADLDWPEGSR